MSKFIKFNGTGGNLIIINIDKIKHIEKNAVGDIQLTADEGWKYSVKESLEDVEAKIKGCIE